MFLLTIHIILKNTKKWATYKFKNETLLLSTAAGNRLHLNKFAQKNAGIYVLLSITWK